MAEKIREQSIGGEQFQDKQKRVAAAMNVFAWESLIPSYDQVVEEL
ncbi:MAG: hypothetical protein JRE58_14805 [Deltaproteobacteria bacterium]|nr:hypothetical protein [Deltaproteobacteria bacterium]